MICSMCGTRCSTTMHNYNYYRFLDSKHSKLVWLPYIKHQANACTYHLHSSFDLDHFSSIDFNLQVIICKRPVRCVEEYMLLHYTTCTTTTTL